MEIMSNNKNGMLVDGYGYLPDINMVNQIVETQQRKASDILLTLEAKVETLTKLVHNQDMLLKLIADRTNKMYAYIDELQKEYKQAQNENIENDQEDPKIISVSNEHQILEAKE